MGLGKACELLQDKSQSNHEHLSGLRDHLSKIIFSNLEDVVLNGCPVNRHPRNLNISIPFVTGEDLVGRLPELVFSTTSACSSGSTKPSSVIASLGVSQQVLDGAFRIGVGKYNTIEEIEYAGNSIVSVAKKLRSKRSQKTVNSF